MPHVSRKRIKTRVAKEFADEFITFLTTAKNKQDARGIAQELLSQTERVMLAKRLATILLLVRGYSFTQIEISLGVTRQTVSRLQRAIRAGQFTRIVSYAQAHSPSPGKSRSTPFLDALIRTVGLAMNTRYGMNRRKNLRALLYGIR